MENKTLALIYDFDKTLSVTDMQNFKFIENLGMTNEQFWKTVKDFALANYCENTLAYLYVMMNESKKLNRPLTEEYLKSLGKYCSYYPGVENWFDSINEYGKAKGVNIEHYIISSGNREILKGTSIASKFKEIFACSFVFNEKGEAVWPKLIINYTTKTQCLFRISKGVLNITEDAEVNKKIGAKHVEFANMIYIGDGITDVPCMALVKERGGLSLGVYNDTQITTDTLVHDNRVDASVFADYNPGSKLDQVVKAKIDLVSLTK